MATIQDMLVNLSQSLDPVEQMITGGAYIIGMMLVLRALYHLKVYGELRTMMQADTSIKTPLTFLTVAAMLMYFPTGMSLILQSSFGYDSPLAYDQFPGMGSVKNGEAMRAMLRLVQVFGMFAFVRGMVLVAKAGGKGSQLGYGKGFTHIFGGVLAINIVGTWSILSNTLGLATT